MKGYIAELDGWSADGAKITDSEKLEIIRTTLEKKGPVILEHRFYRGGRGPDTLIFDEFDKFMDYLNEHGRAGDHMIVWSFWDVCKDDNILTRGKCPDDAGRVPKGGAY